MAGKFIHSLQKTLFKCEDAIVSAIVYKLQPVLCIDIFNVKRQKPRFTIKNIWNDGFLWAVPKHRRSIEKRLARKFGSPIYNWKPLIPKTNLLNCKRCGHFHESYTICGHCYDKVKEESKAILETIDNFKLKPINKEVVVLYKGEKELKSDEFWKGQRIVEIPKKRPSWFHQNLLEPTTQKLSNSKEVKPNDDLA